MREYVPKEQDKPMETEYSQPGLSRALAQLELINSRLRSLGIAVFVFTLLNLLALLVVWFGAFFFLSFGNDAFRSAFSIQVTALVCALLFTVLHEFGRKQGDTLFEEISDELQWNVRGARLSEGKAVAAERPVLQARLVLRTFARASDLPLVPGKFGAAVYVVVNLLILFSEFLRFFRF